MSRDLKFRVWNTVLKKYVCPNVVEQKDGLWLNLGNEDNLYEFEQYTGLKDKNGKEIYEGDIVRLYEHDWWDGKIVKHHKNPKIEGNFVVYYNDDTASFEMENTQPYEDNGIRGVEPFGFASQEYEVIGNIHENPELLGGEE